MTAQNKRPAGQRAEVVSAKGPTKASPTMPQHSATGKLKRAELLAHARECLRLGWKLLPVGQDKKPLNGVGLRHATDNIVDVQRWLRDWPDMRLAGTPPEGTTVVDVDCYKDPEVLAPVADQLRALGGPVQTTQSGGLHFLVADPVPSASDLRKLHGSKAIDVKASGAGYVLLAPSPGYAWDVLPNVAAPTLPAAWGTTPSKNSGAQRFEDLQTWEQEREKVRAALRVLDPDMDEPQWIRVGQALHSIDPDSDGPFDAWDEWSSNATRPARSGKHVYPGTAALRKHWRRFRRSGKRLRAGTLYIMAKDADPNWRDKLREPAPKDGDHVPSRALSDYESAAVPWLLRDVLARGHMTILVGEGGVGKSVFAARVVHTLIHGGHWPSAGFARKGAELKPAGAVALLVSEEDIKSGLVPRYEAQGTDTSQIELLGEVQQGEEPYWVQLDQDMAKVARTIEAYPNKHGGRRICALVVDPITGYLGDTDQNSEAALREMLHRLVAMAREADIAILALIHPNKKIDLTAVNRIMGGKAFSAVSRHVLAMQADPDDSLSRYAVVVKTNIGTQGLAFITHGIRTVHPKDPEQAVWTCSIDPELEHDVDVDALARQAQRKAVETTEATESVAGWVLQALSGAGMRGMDRAALISFASSRWRNTPANEGKELPQSFDVMVRTALSRLSRKKRVMRAMSNQVEHGQMKRQRYFHAEHYDAELSEALC